MSEEASLRYRITGLSLVIGAVVVCGVVAAIFS